MIFLKYFGKVQTTRGSHPCFILNHDFNLPVTKQNIFLSEMNKILVSLSQRGEYIKERSLGYKIIIQMVSVGQGVCIRSIEHHQSRVERSG